MPHPEQPHPDTEIPTGNGLCLKPLEAKDAPAYFALVEESREHLSQFHDTTSEKYQTLESVEVGITQPDKIRFGIWSNDNFVGTVNLKPKERGCFELGYWVGERHAGRGYVTDATAALIEYARRHLDAEEIIAFTYPDNGKSVAVLKRLGFDEQTTETDHRLRRDRRFSKQL